MLQSIELFENVLSLQGKQLRQLMITFPCAKINLGLNIVAKREDGFHDLETVFYPVPLTDALEVKLMDEHFPSEVACDLKITGNTIDGDEQQNLVCKAYNLLARDFSIPRIHAHLYKRIPSQAGLGGGSSDAAFMIRLLDERFRLNIGNAEMERYAAQLGADCAFFITAEPSFATGKGEILAPVDTPQHNLNGYYLAIVKPPVAVSTADAFKNIAPKRPLKCCRDIVRQPIGTWKEQLTNDFEQTVFAVYPQLADIKRSLYAQGALYAQMSGSGSSIFGLFNQAPNEIEKLFSDAFVFVTKL